jgi:hypothetical protein
MKKWKSWDTFFRAFIRLSEKKKVEVAKMLKQDPRQAREHPKYFTSQVFAILQFIEGYSEVLPKEVKVLAKKVYGMLEEKEP